MTALVDLVARSLEDDAREAFDRRVEAGAAFISEALADGRLDNADPTIGLELECYVVDDEGRLATLPEGCLADTAVNRELGRHNLEINTRPTVLSADGVTAQGEEVREQLETAGQVADEHDRRVVLDAMWTVPPPEGTAAYLSAVDEEAGLVFARNMHREARYHAMDNDIVRRAGGTVELALPGVEASFPTILVESLATSIQPHLQVPAVETFPAYYNAAIRTLAPVLALSTNSPFLPADLYGDADADEVLATTYHELRVPVFEQSINAGQPFGKVRFPRDVEAPTDVVDRVVADPTLVPFLREWVDDEAPAELPDGGGGAGEARGDDAADFADEFWEFSHKHGTYWRWIRGVVGGDYVDERNDERSLRIEYRPLPTQPSVPDLVGLQCLVAGLLRGLVATEHPIESLGWEAARDSFYAVVERGLDAEVRWVTADGTHTTDPAVVYPELFEVARSGLEAAGIPPGDADRHLAPIERRWESRTTPSRWKMARVREAVEDGQPLPGAIESMQRAYFARADPGTPFVEWA